MTHQYPIKLRKATIQFNLIIFLFSIFLALTSNAQQFVLHNTGSAPNSLQTLAIDEDDRIWVAKTTATSGNIDYFHNGVWTLLGWESHNLLSAQATDMVINNGILEIGSYGKTSRIDWSTPSFETWDANGDAVKCVEKDVDRNLLYAGKQRLYVYNDTVWTKLNAVIRPSAMVFDKKNDILWVGTLGYGLFKIVGDSIEKYDFNDLSILSHDIFDIDVDGNGDVWLVIEGDGLVQFDGSSWTIFDTSNSAIVNNDPTKIAIDHLNNIWIGGFNYGGLSYFDKSNFTHYLYSNQDIPTSNIRQMKVDSKNNLWMVTGSGLMEFSLSPNATATSLIQSVSIYPNPAHSSITIPNYMNIKQLDVFNQFGQQKISSKSNNSTIDISHLPQGLYYLQMTTNTGEMVNAKFVKGL